MKIALVLLLITISLPGLAQDGLNPTFEFSGVDNFWEIVDLLKADRDPTDAQWSRLFTTPGYAELIQREFKQNRLREFISTAYKPSLKEQRLNTIARADKKGGFWKWFVNSYYQAFDYSDINRSKIIAKRNSFNTFPYTDKAVSELLKFLPETEVSNPPAVSFIIFNDSRGYTPVVMGLNDMVKDEEQLSPQQTKTLKEQGFTKFRPQVLYFAHEFFHHFRDKKLEFKFPEKDNDDSVSFSGISTKLRTRELPT